VIVVLAVAAACAPTVAASADAPRITGASMSPVRFAVDHSGPPELQEGRAHGTTFRYDLSKKADVFFFFDRGAKGRVVGGHCRRQTSTNSHHRSCPFYVHSGSFKQAGASGANVKRFSGRIGKLTFRPDHYRVRIVAVDSMGNPSPGKTMRFTILHG
jgi:hypothetical protein